MAFERLQIQKRGILVEMLDGSVCRVIDTPNATQLHDHQCDLQEGVTLKDIFLLVSKNADFWDSLLGNWYREIVTEGLKPSLKVAHF